MVSYLQRVNISVAAKFMMPELSLSEIQMGQVFSSFMLGYALFQVPAGVLGDRLGPRFVLTLAALSWGIATVLTGLVPGLLIGSGSGIFISLLVIRFLLGAGEAATYPVAARAIANWIPGNKRALGNAIVLAGMPLGSAVTPPLVSWLMVNVGWRQTFYITSGLAFLIALLWRSFATDFPQQHSGVSKAELALISSGQSEPVVLGSNSTLWWKLLKKRNMCLLSLSYFFEGYVLFIFVFWFYLYLVDVRGFSVLSGGIFASLPWIVSLVSTPMGGAVCDSLCTRLGRLPGSRIVVMCCYFFSALLLFLGARVDDRYLAVASLSLSVGFLMAAEASFWSSAVHLAGPYAGSACGIMNTAGILGGFISTLVVPIAVKHFGWLTTFDVGSAIAIVCALIWLGIQPQQVLEGNRLASQEVM